MTNLASWMRIVRAVNAVAELVRGHGDSTASQLKMEKPAATESVGRALRNSVSVM